MAAEQRDWTSLPRDILARILENFQTFDEYLLFGRVCEEFSLVVKDHKGWQELSNPRLPLLMAPSKDDPMNRRILYNVVDNKLCDLQLALPYDGRFCGSSHGWLASFGSEMVIRLKNLFSGRCIELPRIIKDPPYELLREFPSLGPSYWIGKVILSENPDDSSPENCIVGVQYELEGWMAFMRLCDEGWTYVDPWLTCNDIMFYSGYLYGISRRGKLIRVDLSISSYVDKEEGEVIVPPSFAEPEDMTYIVESCRGDMLMIRRFVEVEPTDEWYWWTTRFEIFRLHTSPEGSRWIEISSLDNEIIFVGDGQSTSFPCTEFPGCKPNRIYFTDDYFWDYSLIRGPIDLGVFNVEDGSVEATYPLNYFESQVMPPPIFIIPKLDDKLFIEAKKPMSQNCCKFVYVSLSWSLVGSVIFLVILVISWKCYLLSWKI